MASPRSYAAAHFALDLGEPIGLFRSVEGGGVRADVMTYAYGHGYDRWKQLGKPKFEDIRAQVGMAMTKPFYDWIKAFTEGKHVRKDGAILAADAKYIEKARREFTQALIKEITFPKLDGSDKGAAYMTLTISPETMTFAKGTGKKITHGSGMDKQKNWTANRFDFQLDGFGSACRRVARIDAFTIKQNILEWNHGNQRHPMKTGSVVEFPNITFYVPEIDAMPFMNRAKERIVDGKRRTSIGQKGGELRTKDGKGRTLFTMEFYDTDIVSVTPEKSDAGSEDIKLAKIELFTEKMVFTYG